MPELPEVEVAKRTLEPLMKGKRILGFWTDWPRGLLVSSPETIVGDIAKRKVEKLERRGKAILIYLSGGRLLALHQRMSGRVLIVPRNFIDPYIHFRFPLSSRKDLVLHDVRKFGLVWYGKEREVLGDKYFSLLGKDPLELDFATFKNLLRGHKGMIKPLLLRQDVFSGIGNIIADETLWRAKIHPRREIERFDERAKKALWSSLRFVLKKSIELGGTSMQFWTAPNGEEGQYFERRSVYGRKGERCPRCGSFITRIILGSRGTFFCEHCQRC